MQNALLEHSAIFLTCIKRLSVLKPVFGNPFEWPFKTGFTVYKNLQKLYSHFPVILACTWHFVYFIAFGQKHPLNARTNVSRGTIYTCICFGHGLHLHPYFVYACSECSGESVQFHNVTRTKIACRDPYM